MPTGPEFWLDPRSDTLHPTSSPTEWMLTPSNRNIIPLSAIDVELLDSFFIEGIEYPASEGKTKPDNIFRNDHNIDIWLTIHLEVDEAGLSVPESLQWD